MSAFPRRYTEIDTIRLNNITIRAADNSIPPDGYILTASTGRAHMLSPLFALDSIPGLSDLQGQISTLSTLVGTGGGGGAPSTWANYPAINNVDLANSNIYSTNTVEFVNGNDIISIDYVQLSNISTAAGAIASGGVNLWANYPAIANINTNSNSIYSTINIALINDADSVNLTYITLSNISTAAGQGQELVPRVSALETFSTAQTTSNIRYDGVSTAFSSLSNNFYSLSTTLISTISTWTGTYTSPTDPTLLGRVTALETFSTAQTTSNIRYDGVSTTQLTISTTAGNLVPRVTALETFSTVIVSTFTTSNILTNTSVFSSIVTSSISTFSASGTANIQQITELIDFEVNAAGNWPHNFNNGSIFYHSNIASNFTTALFNVPIIPGRAIVTTLVLIQGATPYYSSTLTINGSPAPIQWANSSIPVPTALKTECESFTIFNIAGSWSALGQYTSFGTA